MSCSKWRKMHFFQNFERDSIFEPQQFEKETKRNVTNLFLQQF